MNKNGCLLFIAVLIISVLIVKSFTVTVRKTTNTKTQQPEISKQITVAENSNQQQKEFTLKREMIPQEQGFRRNAQQSGRYFEQNQTMPPINHNKFNKNSRFKPEPAELSGDFKRPEMPHNAGQKPKMENPLKFSVNTCKPYSETMMTKYMGVFINYRIDIAGWYDNKCVVNFEAKATGLSSDYLSEYGFDTSEAEVSAFTPKIRCEFTKEQLLYVGDSILEEKSRASNPEKRMLKDPNTLSFPKENNMSASDLKLLDILIQHKACKITNWDEFRSRIQQVTDFLQF